MQLPFRYALYEMGVLAIFIMVTFPMALLVLRIKIRKEYIVL
jgi:hypothetical protein